METALASWPRPCAGILVALCQAQCAEIKIVTSERDGVWLQRRQPAVLVVLQPAASVGAELRFCSLAGSMGIAPRSGSLGGLLFDVETASKVLGPTGRSSAEHGCSNQ